jgi:hypothetical protein
MTTRTATNKFFQNARSRDFFGAGPIPKQQRESSSDG